MPSKLISTAARSLFAVLLLALGVTGIGCGFASAPAEDQKPQPDVKALPQAVRNALDRAERVYAQPLSGAKWSEVDVHKGSEHPVYQVRGTNARGNTIEIEITPGGRVIEVEEHGIAFEETPAAVRDTLTKQIPGFKAKKVEAIYQTENARPYCYGFEGTDGDGKEVELYVTADGKTVLN